MEKVLVEPGVITRITLNRPERHNALDTEGGDVIVDAIRVAGRDPSVKVIILKGNGPSFSSGDDRSEGAAYHNPEIEAIGLVRHPYFQLVSLIRQVPKAVIAQVHGYCLAAGMDVMLACDFAYADPDAKFGMLFGHMGLPCGAVFLPKYLGLKRANRLLFFHEHVSAQEAYELGLITKVAEPGRLKEEVEALAEQIVGEQSRRYAHFGLLKESVNRALFSTLEEDVRQQALMTRLQDFYNLTHPVQQGGGR
jgi:2-(1,2-epoxy-1,2-dihydrophenyl)acetyl-CoA isomerase